MASEGGCSAEYAFCDDNGGTGSTEGTGPGNTCEKCVTGFDGYTYCKNPNVYGPASGPILSPCRSVLRCYWLGWWACYYDCDGAPCYSV